MNTDFKTYIELVEVVERYGAILIPEDFSWAKKIGKMLPGLDLGLPKVQRSAKIEIIMDKKNPIYVQLGDGSKLFFTHDEFRRIEGEPKRGKTMTVTMQRLTDDNSEFPSQIIHCKAN